MATMNQKSSLRETLQSVSQALTANTRRIEWFLNCCVPDTGAVRGSDQLANP